MAQLPDRTLNWLWLALQTYAQPRLVYSDVVAALSQIPTLQAMTKVYSFETGQSDLLLCLYGSIPVDFRGSLYRYPVEIWIPKEYGQPGHPVMAYVKPDTAKQTADQSIVVRPGQYVGGDGRIYHPYLRDWGQYERASIMAFVQLMQSIFAREPPIVSRAQPPKPPGTPALPPKQRPGERSHADPPTSAGSAPPPLPAKPGRPVPNLLSSPASNSLSHQETPPRSFMPYNDHGPSASPTPSSRTSQPGPPPLPPLPAASHLAHTNGSRTPVSPISPATSTPTYRHDQREMPPSQLRYAAPHPAPPAQSQAQHQQRHYPPAPQSMPQPQYQQQYAHPQQLPQYQLQYQQQARTPAAAPAQQSKPRIDLLTDPFDVSLAPALPAGPAPPIPPNPEREHLLQALSSTLVAQTNAKIHQAQSAVAPLTAQRQALLEAQARLQAEMHQLQALDTVLGTNEGILHQSLRDCQVVIERSRETPQPNIDEVLVAPTVAAQQLWNLCAEEAAIKEVMWCLQRAVGAGRVSGAEFVRLTRSLARECFLKMALARKVAQGLGLDVQAGRRGVY